MKKKFTNKERSMLKNAIKRKKSHFAARKKRRKEEKEGSILAFIFMAVIMLFIAWFYLVYGGK